MPVNALFIAVGLVILLVAVVVAYKIGFTARKKSDDGKIESAEAKAREIIDGALKAAEEKKREGLLEIKEESIRTRNELEKETKERRAEVQRLERRVQQKEENIDKKTEQL